MSSLHQSVNAITFIFGAAFKAKLDGLDAARAKREADDASAPSFDFGYRETAGEDAFRVGYELGLDREDELAPAHYTPHEARCFRGGLAAGRREWNRRLEIMCGEADYADFSNRITDRDIYPAGSVS